MSAVALALDALFFDPNIARYATYIAEGGAPQLIRVVDRRADEVTGFGEARLWSETTRIDLRVAEKRVIDHPPLTGLHAVGHTGGHQALIERA